MIDYLPVWRDTEAIRASSADGFVRQFGKLQVKLKDYFGVLFKEIGLVSVVHSPLGSVGVCSFVSVPIDGARFEWRLIVDSKGASVRVSPGSGCTGLFVRNADVDSVHFEIDESDSWSDVSLRVLDCISQLILKIEIKNQTSA